MGLYDDEVFSPEEGQEKPQEAPKKEEPPEESILDELLKKKGFKSPDDFAKSYEELEKELTRRGQEGKAKEKELEDLKNQLNQAIQYIQSLQPNQKKEIEIDPDIDEALTPEGRKAIEKLLKKHLEAEGQVLGQALQQVLSKIQEEQTKAKQEISELKIARYFDKQAEKLAKTHSDFDELREEIANVFDQFPELADPTKHPNGMEEAYRYVKAQRLLKGQEEETSAREKAAARLPGGTGRRLPKELTPEEKLLEQIFGSDKEPQGIYG